MNLIEYQYAAWQTALPSAKTPAYMYVGLAGEVGELASIYAKEIRDGLVAGSTEKVKKELGDVLWFVAGIASLYGLSLQEVAQGNIDKLNSRKERNTLTGSGDDR
jgi:NTP pyrophosphatase (non-canonical NTP hydrolase)